MTLDKIYFSTGHKSKEKQNKRPPFIVRLKILGEMPETYRVD